MISSRWPPTFIPATPWSQPGITSPAPRVKLKGSLRLQEESNSLPLLKPTPTYWTVTLSPDFASAPLPGTSSLLSSFFGGAPFGTVTTGFLPVSSEEAPFVVASVDSVAPVDESSPPQPASSRPAHTAIVSISAFIAAILRDYP